MPLDPDKYSDLPPKAAAYCRNRDAQALAASHARSLSLSAGTVQQWQQQHHHHDITPPPPDAARSAPPYSDSPLPTPITNTPAAPLPLSPSSEKPTTTTTSLIPSTTSSTTPTLTPASKEDDNSNNKEQGKGYSTSPTGIRVVDEGEKDNAGRVLEASHERCEECGGKVVWATKEEYLLICEKCGEPQ